LVSACQEKKIVFGIVGVLLPMRFPNGTAGKRYRSETLVFTGALGEIRTPDPQIRSLVGGFFLSRWRARICVRFSL
jgi:hypothetical protein